MQLDIQHYTVQRMQFGRQTAYAAGSLTICREELLAILFNGDAFMDVDLQIACPGDSARIANILEISAPRVKAGPAAGSYYPGMICSPYQAGTGITNALQGCTVMEVGQLPGLFGGLVDMQGRGADLTPFSVTHNLCVVATPRPAVDKLEYASALKRAGLQTAVYLARATLNQPADDIMRFALAAQPSATSSLPRVGYLCQMYSSGNLREPFIYGAHYRQYYPTLLHPNEILDGAVVCGHYDASFALKNTTFTLVHHPVILDLYRRHGREIDFRGVIIAPEPTTLEEIQRTAMMSAGLLKNALGADGVIITKEGGGHTSVDTMASCDACEGLGIRTVLIDNEWLGPEGTEELPVLSMTANADAMISIGNMEEVVDLGPMDRVIGGGSMDEVEGDLQGRASIPMRCIPEAISQLGASGLIAKSCAPGSMKRNVDCGEPACRRAAQMLLKKLRGRAWKSEIPFPAGWPPNGIKS